METRNYWEGNGHAVKYDNYNSKDSFSRVGSGSGSEQLNFSATATVPSPSDDEAEYPPGSGSYLKKGKQDPMSHRIIEKRRRDRMNNCLADLSRLIPPEYLKKGRGRVEKTEIIEMAIRHLKFLQERADVNGRRVVGEFRAGYHAAAGEAVRFLVEAQGYVPGDGLCQQMAAHLQRHCEIGTKGEVPPREKLMSLPSLTSRRGSSSETTSSSGSSHGYPPAPAPPPALPPPYSAEPCEPDQTMEPYPMECDRLSLSQLPSAEKGFCPDEPLPLDGRRSGSGRPAHEPALRAVRKPEHDDYLQSYKFKNSIERRFSRSQDNEAADMLARTAHAHCKMYSNKRRRAAKMSPSTSTSASGSTEETQDTSPQDTSSQSSCHQHYDKLPATQYVPVFALNTLGNYYVPLSVDHACLAQHLGPYDELYARAVQFAAPLHPVTIRVNFQPYLNYHVKREPAERWREV